jgi:predicted nucleic acid-binding protein
VQSWPSSSPAKLTKKKCKNPKDNKWMHLVSSSNKRTTKSVTSKTF